MNNEEYSPTLLSLKFDPENELYSPSDQFGYNRLYFDFTFAANQLTNMLNNKNKKYDLIKAPLKLMLMGKL